MIGEGFQLNEQTLSVVEEIGSFMPGGFFVYKAKQPEELLYANRVVFDIFGCGNEEEFRELTGYTFKGMLHPEDYEMIEESIDHQIQTGNNGLDYVVYRIIRKDGEVRWVDDYGHYVETEAYGGVYFVFISDITEKRERMVSDVRDLVAARKELFDVKKAEEENIQLLKELEAAAQVTDLMSSVASLLTNIPAMTFSKDTETGVYLACNQAFADFARKETPEGVIGQTDFDLFDPVTAEHFRNDDHKTVAMDKPYVFFEDVPDAAGVMCHFQTTKLKFTDHEGRLCTLGMKVDVTEITRVKTAEAEAKAREQELKERLALQEKLLEEERQRVEQDRLITALAADYWSVYYLDLDKDEGVCYQSHSDVDDGFKVGERFKYLPAVTAYANRYITEKYRDGFLKFIQPDAIREKLKEERVIGYRYKVNRHGGETYEMVRFAGVRNSEDVKDQAINSVSACFTNVDAETRRALAQGKALRDALTAAEEANKAKTVFLSNMSHEIRTPMNAIIGLDNIALHDPDISEKTRENLEKIGSSAQHLLNIINDILDMSRIESGRMTLRNEEFSFAKTLEQVNTIISGQCRDKLVAYECRIKNKIDDYYIGDDMKLRQILINILGNAVKFTPEGGRIEFTIERTAQYDGKSTLCFVISDTGIGMSKEFLPKLFDTFSQEETSAAAKYGSTGLGMSITKSLVELMNGHIEVTSEKGVGTVFTVTVTLTDSDHASGGADEGDLRPHELSVLVIDDDPVACEHARVVLGQVGISCETAQSGEKALKLVEVRHARRDPYDLILVDWRMPDLDGIETTRRIRSMTGSESAIIILTSYHWDDVADEAREAGVDSFVAKPLFAGSVLDEFREAFRKKNASKLKSKKNLSGRRILLAEDMDVNAEIMVMVLAMREIEADIAENGKIAVEMFAAHEPGYYDAILMDMRMPVMNGLEATKEIRAMDRKDAGTIPIIALTANAFDEDVQRSMQAGLNAHLSKPVEPDALFETLESLIK